MSDWDGHEELGPRRENQDDEKKGTEMRGRAIKRKINNDSQGEIQREISVGSKPEYCGKEKFSSLKTLLSLPAGFIWGRET